MLLRMSQKPPRNALSHLDPHGAAHMVGVGGKSPSRRRAVAEATLRMRPRTLVALREGNVPKGDVLAVARVAAIAAVKRTWDLIPLCHPIHTTGCDVSFQFDSEGARLHLRVEVRAIDRTGVEMEAMTGASIGALTVYDMVKGLERGVVIERIALNEKEGGRGGPWRREETHARGEPDEPLDGSGGSHPR